MHALAQGNVVIVGTCASANGSKVQVNLLASGRIPQRRAGGAFADAQGIGWLSRFFLNFSPA